MAPCSPARTVLAPSKLGLSCLSWREGGWEHSIFSADRSRLGPGKATRHWKQQFACGCSCLFPMPFFSWLLSICLHRHTTPPHPHPLTVLKVGLCLICLFWVCVYVCVLLRVCVRVCGGGGDTDGHKGGERGGRQQRLGEGAVVRRDSSILG